MFRRLSVKKNYSEEVSTTPKIILQFLSLHTVLNFLIKKKIYIFFKWKRNRRRWFESSNRVYYTQAVCWF